MTTPEVQLWYLDPHLPDQSIELASETPLQKSFTQTPLENVQTEQIQIETENGLSKKYDENRTLYGTPGSTSTQKTGLISKHQVSNAETEYTDDQIDSKPSRYEKAWALNALNYIYAVRNLFELRKKNKTKILELEDLPLLGKTEEVNHKILELEAAYEKYKKKHKNPSLFWPLMRVFWSRVFKEQLWVIIYNAAKLIFALFLSRLIENVEKGDKTTAYKWAGGLFGCVYVGFYGHHQAFFQGNRLISQLKPAVIGLIYKKINRLSYFTVNQVSIGKIVNIVANDLNNFEFNIFWMYYLIVSPFVLGGALAILWSFFGVACLPGIGFVLLVWPFQYLLSKLGGRYVKQKNYVTDDRIKMTNEMIEGIRLLKMYGWDMQFARSIESKRNLEVSLLKKLGFTEYISGHLSNRLTPVLGSFVIFITYGLTDNTLTAGKVFATIIMMVFLRVSIVLYAAFAFKFAIEARLTFDRIIQLLEVKEHDTQASFLPPKDPANGIEFENFSVYWGEEEKYEKNPKKTKKSRRVKEGTLKFEQPTLKNISFSIKKGTLCALVGKIGSGKSTALMSFFGEVPKTAGELRYSGSIAYVEQEIVVYPGTVRSNILFGKPYDEEKYNRIVEACCLLDDFKEFPNADFTEIGERGVNLSGGQKARTSLARALYSDADIYLLDDPLSAVDTKVAKNLFNKAIREILRDKTVILATHQVHFAREAEKIVVLENGELKAEGTLDEIIRQDATILSIFETQSKRKTTEELGEPGMTEVVGKKDEVEKIIATVKQETEEEELDEAEREKRELEKAEKGRLIEKEQDESTKVGFKTYWYYIRNMGNCLFIFFFLLILAGTEVLYVFYSIFLGYWTENTWEPKTAMKALAGLIGGFILCLICRELSFVHLGLEAAKILHNKILYRVIRAKTEFFDTNPAGRILNRFSNDVGVLDRYLMMVSSDCVDAIFYFAALFVTLWIVTPLLLIPGAVLVIFVLLLVKLVKKAIIQGRGIELVTRSPIYSFFSTTLTGLVSIRVYRQGNMFVKQFTHLLNKNIRAYNSYYDSTRILGFYSDFFSATFACVGIVILISVDSSNPGLIGLSCSYLLSIAEYVQWAIRQVLTHVMQMASTERLKGYSEIEQEAGLTLPGDKQLQQGESWPSKGEVIFNNVHMKYRKTTDHVLKGLSFNVKAGEKIGCVGRTGAGKSSIIQALFRMVEIDREGAPGSSITIDGVDTQDLGLHLIRKSISIIPQTPFIFMGTVRRNLDPLQEYNDEKIIHALEETNLWEYVKTLPNQLDTDMSNASSVFSVGQKQLICLARTLLQNNKILVLDEATANIDFETDNFIQHKILEKFKDSTIFTIAHRLSTVANYDKVLVMDKGQAVEFDHPYKLLVKTVGDQQITNTEGVFASMVMNTGVKHSAVIFEIARKSYFKEVAQ